MFLTAGGYRPTGGFFLALVAWMRERNVLLTLLSGSELLFPTVVVLFSRGPHLANDKWMGYSGGWELSRGVSDRAKAAKEAKEIHSGKEEIEA